MKKVFDNSMVAHIWAQQNQPEARSNNGNFWFEGATIWSYATAMATFLKPYHFKAKDNALVFINVDSYSVTTSSHQSDIRQANRASRMDTFYVSGEFMQRLARDSRVFTTNDHRDTRKRYVQEEANRRYAESEIMLNRASTARGRKDEYLQNAKDEVQRAKMIAKLFKVRITMPKLMRELIEKDDLHIFARVADLKAENKRKRAIQLKKAQKLEGDQFEAWLNDERNSCPRSYQTSPSGGVYMRRVTRRQPVRFNPETETHESRIIDELQTSQGARVPWSHALRVFQALKAIRDKGEAWQANGRRLRVGHFEVDRIEANGDFVAGCHKFKWADIEPFALAHGAFNLDADDSAITSRES